MNTKPFLVSGYVHLIEPTRTHRKQHLDLAVIEFSRAIQLNFEDLHTQALLHNGRGYAFYELGCLTESKDEQQTLLDKAVDDLSDTIEYEPSMVVAHHNLGLVYAKQGKIKKAAEELEYPIPVDNNPGLDTAILHYNRGCFYHTMKRSDAQKDLMRALELSDDLPVMVYSLIGDIFAHKHELRKTVEYFKAATKAMDSKTIPERGALDYVGAIYAAHVLFLDDKAGGYAEDANQMKILTPKQIDFIKETTWCRCPEGLIETIFPFSPILSDK